MSFWSNHVVMVVVANALRHTSALRPSTFFLVQMFSPSPHFSLLLLWCLAYTTLQPWCVSSLRAAGLLYFSPSSLPPMDSSSLSFFFRSCGVLPQR